MTKFTPTLIPATIADHPTIQNLGRFYAYDLSRYCGFGSEDWWMPSNGLYECLDFKQFFDNPQHKVFIIRIGKELVGFAIVTKGTDPVDWFVEEFYVIAKYQGKGVAKAVINQIWSMMKGNWEISVIPENIPALHFWRKVVGMITDGNFKEEVRSVDYDTYQPTRHFLSFSI